MDRIIDKCCLKYLSNSDGVIEFEMSIKSSEIFIQAFENVFWNSSEKKAQTLSSKKKLTAQWSIAIIVRKRTIKFFVSSKTYGIY